MITDYKIAFMVQAALYNLLKAAEQTDSNELAEALLEITSELQRLLSNLD